jgi:hypothetical protein
MFDKIFVRVLIVFFLLLIGILLFHEIKKYYYNYCDYYGYHYSVVEGLENKDNTYKEYDPNDPMILSQQNAGNIAVLKKQMDEILALKEDVYDMSLNMVEMAGQINDFAESQKQTADDTIGTEDPNITGATDEPLEEEEVTDE